MRFKSTMIWNHVQLMSNKMKQHYLLSSLTKSCHQIRMRMEMKLEKLVRIRGDVTIRKSRKNSRLQLRSQQLRSLRQQPPSRRKNLRKSQLRSQLNNRFSIQLSNQKMNKKLKKFKNKLKLLSRKN